MDLGTYNEQVISRYSNNEFVLLLLILSFLKIFVTNNSTAVNEEDFEEILDIPGEPQANDVTYNITQFPQGRFVFVQRQLLSDYLDLMEIEILTPSSID